MLECEEHAACRLRIETVTLPWNNTSGCVMYAMPQPQPPR